MQIPPIELDSNFNQLDNQEKTQLTVGGSPVAGEFRAGDIVDNTYEILSLLGSGGMGHVYRVRHTIMNQEYALKALSCEQVSEAVWRRFQNEAQAIARMSHPNVVAIYNLGLHDTRLPFYVMELVQGQTLLELLREAGCLNWHDALVIFSEIASGLGYAHKKGIVHRDIKPPNILILSDNPPGATGRVKLVDFGIAKLSGVKDKANQRLTSVGEICGSPYYMSPEQCNGGRVDARSDIYSFGCTLFEALTGNPPFKGRNAMETMLLHQTAAPPSLKAATGRPFPRALEQSIATMLEKAPMDRYQTMELILQDFSNILEGKNEAISPYTTQRQTHVRGLSAPDMEEDDRKDVAVIGAIQMRDKTIKRAVGSVLAAFSGLAVIGAAAGALYWFMTPSQSKPLISHFGAGDSSQSTTSPKNIATRTSNLSSPVFDETTTTTFVPTAIRQQAGVSIRNSEPFSERIVKHDKPGIAFNFPDDFELGNIDTESAAGTFRARGRVELLLEQFRELVPNPSLAYYPQYLRRFQPGDLDSVLIGPPCDNTAMIDAISNIKGLKTLRLKIADGLNDSCIPALSKMTSLTSLEADDTGITGPGLAKLPYLKRLKSIAFNGGEKVDPLLQALAGSTKLEALFLQHSLVSAAGFKALGTLPNLRELRVDGSPVSDNDLRALSKAPSLARLSVVHCGVTLKQIEILKQFPVLEVLVLDPANHTTSEKAAIKKALGKVKVQ